MTHIQKQLIETYENSGYSAALDFWKENSNRIGNLSSNEISILKNTMSRYCLINNDEKVSEIISLEDKQQFLHNNAIMELLFSMDYVLVKGNKEINDFYVVRNVVTQELYQKIMGINPSVYKQNMKPVVNVSWYDTIYFCNKLSINSGLRPVYYVSGTSDVETWEYKPHQGECLMGDINQDISANGFRLLSLDESYWFYARNSSKKTDFKILNNPDNYDENNMRGSVWEWVWGDYSSGRTYKYCCSGSYVMFHKEKIYKAKEQSDSIGIRIGRSVFN